MAESGAEALRGKRLLVVEDEYLIAVDLACLLEDRGVVVVGSAGSVGDALELISREGALDGAVLDVNLGENGLTRSPTRCASAACRSSSRPATTNGSSRTLTARRPAAGSPWTSACSPAC
jgi:ActR/RegA family two-component response regulator